MFGILLILMQIAICLIYAFLVWLPPQQAAAVNAGNVTFSPIIITILLFFMVVVGNDIYYISYRFWFSLGLFKKTCLECPWI